MVDTDHPSAEFLLANPLGLIPALSIGELHVTDSANILDYLHENYGERIWPKDLARRQEVRNSSYLALGVMHAAVSLMLETNRPAPDADWVRFHNQAIFRALQVAETQMETPWPLKVSDLQMTQAGYDWVIAFDYLEFRHSGLSWDGRPWHAWVPRLRQFYETHRVRQDLAPSVPKLG